MKILRISNAYTNLESSIYGISKLVPEIEDYYLFEVGDPGPADLSVYDVVWCYTGAGFDRENYPEFFAKLDAYEGRTVNWRCIEGLSQEIMTQKWLEEGLLVPEFIQFPTCHLAQHDEMPDGWEFPLMIKACREYPRVSFAKVINDDQEYATWMKEHGEFSHILQRYLPFDSSDQLYYCGQLYIIGEEMYPRTTRWTNHWYVSPTYRGVPHLGLEVGGFTSFPGFTSHEDIFAQARQIADLVDIDLGTLDFSLTDDGKVIPWGICTVYPFYTEGSDAIKEGVEGFPAYVDQLGPQVMNWNRTLAYLGIERMVTPNQIWRIIRACNLNM